MSHAAAWLMVEAVPLMLDVSIPGAATQHLEHLVLDFNGALACDGVLIGGVLERLFRLAAHLRIHIVTGDTFGTVCSTVSGLPCELRVLGPTGQAQAKREFVLSLGPYSVACIGNGRNDLLMLREAALGIAVLQAEGAHAATLAEADVVVPSIVDALDLLLHPLRLCATLRG